jgi:hypothetical protein
VDLPTLAGKPIRRGRRLSWVGISVYPSGNTAVAAGGIKQGQRVQSITVVGLTQPEGPGGPSPARRSRRVLLPGWDPSPADCAAEEDAKPRSEARVPASRPKSAEIDEQGRLITGLSAPLWLSLELFPEHRGKAQRENIWK